MANNTDYLKRNEHLDFGNLIASPNTKTKLPAQIVLDVVPNNKKLRVARNVINAFFEHNNKVNNHIIANLSRKRGVERITKDDYLDKTMRKKYDTKIKNLLKTINKYVKPLGYVARSRGTYCELINENR